MKKKRRFRKIVVFLLCATLLMTQTGFLSVESENLDWKTETGTEDDAVPGEETMVFGGKDSGSDEALSEPPEVPQEPNASDGDFAAAQKDTELGNTPQEDTGAGKTDDMTPYYRDGKICIYNDQQLL